MAVLRRRKGKVETRFDRYRFVVDCRSAPEADGSHQLVRKVAKRAVLAPAAILKALGEPSAPCSRANCIAALAR